MAEKGREEVKCLGQAKNLCGDEILWEEQVWKKRISLLFNNDLLSDIAFIVKDRRFPAHKFVLAAASRVFAAMFYGPMADDKQEIEIVDCERPDEFLEFLSLIYKKSAAINWENLNQLSYLKKKYLVMESGPFCKLVKETVGTYTSLDALNKCVDLEEESMIEECMKIIREDISMLVKTGQFFDLDQRSLKLILKQDRLDISEIDLFNAVDRWCSNQVQIRGNQGETATKREVLGDAINYIRFPTIEMKDFAKYCRQSKLLTSEEFVDLTAAIALRSDEEVDDDDDEGKNFNLASVFVGNRRKKGCIFVNLNHLDVDTRYNKKQCTYRIELKSNSKVWLKGVDFHLSGSYVLQINDTKIGYDDQEEEKWLKSFKQPFLMQASQWYELTCQCSNEVINDIKISDGTKYQWNEFECELKTEVNVKGCVFGGFVFSLFDADPLQAATEVQQLQFRCDAKKVCSISSHKE